MSVLGLKVAPVDEAQPYAETSVLLLDMDMHRSSVLRKALLDAGLCISDRIQDSSKMLACLDRHNVDCIVAGVDLPDQQTLDNLSLLTQHKPMPIVMFAEQDTPQIIQKVVKSGVNAFIVDDIQASRIRSIVELAIARFKEKQALLNELHVTKHKLEERKVLDKAKGLLMTKKGCTENEAYTSLRKMSMDKGLPIATVAQNIIDVMELVD